MKKLVTLVLFLALAACGGGEKSQPTTPDPVAQPDPMPADPTPTEPAKPPEPPPFEVALGELVIYDGAEPGFKLHADGTTEVAHKSSKTTGKGKKAKVVTSTEWKAGPTVKADGSVAVEGNVVGKFGRDGVTDPAGKTLLPYTLGADSLTVKAPDGDVTLQLVPEGVKLVGGPMDGKVSKIEATDDKVKMTALLLIVLSSGSSPEAAPADGGAAPKSSK